MERLRRLWEDTRDLEVGREYAIELVRRQDVESANKLMADILATVDPISVGAARDIVVDYAKSLARSGLCFEAVRMVMDMGTKLSLPQDRVFVQGMNRGPLINLVGDLVNDQPLIHETTGIELRFMDEGDIEWWRLWAVAVVESVWGRMEFLGRTVELVVDQAFHTARYAAVGMADEEELYEVKDELSFLEYDDYQFDELISAIYAMTEPGPATAASSDSVDQLTAYGGDEDVPGQVAYHSAMAEPHRLGFEEFTELLFRIGTGQLDPRVDIPGYNFPTSITDHCVSR